MQFSFEDLTSVIPNVSRETYLDLCKYEDALRRWNPKINLVSSDTLSELWTRHFIDSLQIAVHLPKNIQSLVDIGSGGGFPGLPLAIACRHQNLQFTMVDSDSRKCEFLRTVARKVGLKVEVINQRIEAVDPLNTDILTARALASLEQLLSFAKHHLAPGGTALFLKGANAEQEIATARRSWNFEIKQHQSLTHPDARILEIGEISRV